MWVAKMVKCDDLLGPAVAMSAGLYARFRHEFIVTQFDFLKSHSRNVKAIHRRLLRGGEAIKFLGLNDLAKPLQKLRTERVIFAGSQFGPPLASVVALTSMGVKVAGVYWALSKTYGRILENRRVRAINLTEQTNRFALIRLLQKLHDDGYVIWLMCDAPGKSRIRYKFLGYSVICANLIEVYARLYGCTVVPTYCRLLSDDEVSVHCGAMSTNYQNMTQRLLSNLQALIYEDPINYLWSGASIVFSDSRAILNGLHFVADFLEWREAALARTK